MLKGFEDKAGNIISIIFFSLLLIFITSDLFFNDQLTKSSLFFLFFLSLSGLAALILSAFFDQKETKIILVSIFLVAELFIFSSFTGILFSASKKFRFMKSLMLSVLILFIIVLLVFIKVISFQDDRLIYESGNQKANSAVILGAAVWGGNRPSPVLKERINKGYEIYKKNLVTKLVLTGGGSPNELTEGEVSKNVLLKYGVAPENLILENQSGSTVEQIQFVRDSLYSAQNWQKIILVSDNFHLYRATEICRFNDINSDCIASDKELSPAGTITFCIKESFALIFFWMTGI
ncbi:MAG TPA: YdcF family protein [Ignavibacteria bacterium]|nr:YdcF family protein [Ignavibacteria bacterium]